MSKHETPAEMPIAESRQGPWTDTEIGGQEQDFFSYQDYADVLLKLIRQPDNTPLTIGILGSWGSGKSSIMRLIDQRATYAPQATDSPVGAIRSIWVNAWQLSDKDEVGKAFVQTLFTNVSSELGFLTRFDTKRVANAVLVNGYKLILVCLPFFFGLRFGVPEAGWGDIFTALTSPLVGGTFVTIALAWWAVLKPMVEKWNEVVDINVDELLKYGTYDEQVSELTQLQRRFADMVQTFQQQENLHCLLVFVDDLDRCTPDKIADVLEAIKMFASVKYCAFVLGVDYDIVLDAVAKRYKFDEAAQASAYLQKIVQVPFRIPPLHTVRMDQFIELNYPDVTALSTDAAEVFSVGLQPNPRKIKRALNNFRLMYDAAEQRWRSFESDTRVEPCLLAKLQVIQEQCPDAYTQICEVPRFVVAFEYWAMRQQQFPELG